MDFCDKCDFQFDIQKAVSDSKKIIKEANIDDLVNAVNRNQNMYNFTIEVPFDTIKENASFQALTPDKKDTIKNLVENPIGKSEFIFHCPTCGFKKPLPNGIVLYSRRYLAPSENKMDDTLVKLMIRDNTLPRTKDYICPKADCLTHDKRNYDRKEAILYRESGSYRTHLVCTACESDWRIDLRS
jgi:DNA-directed RNA polymerase subunit M/transcription elongation factor TFIIS